MTEETGHALQVSQEASTNYGTRNEDMSIILETQEIDISGFEVGEKVKLLHAVHNIKVAVATVSQRQVPRYCITGFNLKVFTKFLSNMLLLVMLP